MTAWLNTWDWSTAVALIVLLGALWVVTAGLIVRHEAHTDEAEREAWLTPERCRELREREEG